MVTSQEGARRALHEVVDIAPSTGKQCEQMMDAKGDRSGGGSIQVLDWRMACTRVEKVARASALLPASCKMCTPRLFGSLTPI